jgi:hypothetical protein
MKYSKYKGILLFWSMLVAFAVEASSDSASVIQSKPVISTNPRTILLSSALVPGFGQFLNRRYLKAGTFLALEAFAVPMAAFWDHTARSSVEEYHRFSSAKSADSLESAHRIKFQTFGYELKRYNYLTWAGGIYLYNLFDAFELTGFLKDNGKRNPSLAFGLAAIPGLGLGQMYNGSYSKAGLFMMTQVQLGVLAYNNHRLMHLAESNYRRVSDTTITLPSIKATESSDWEGRRRTAMKNRNSFLWYSIFTYVIGMLDAVVDAHLHDYQEKMRIEPDLVPSENGTGLNLQFNF